MSTTTVNIRGHLLRATYEYHRPCRGSSERGGRQLEPDEPESVEVESVEPMDDGVDLLTLLDTFRNRAELEQLVAEAVLCEREADRTDREYDEERER
jgi:hypothetical protein